jgi:hypothetical protein
MFTPGQIAFIENIVDKRIAQHNHEDQDPAMEGPAAPLTANGFKPYYHTTRDIRALIVRNKATLQESLGKVFHVAVLAHELAQLTVLGEGDLELRNDRNYSRWADQVRRAINSRNWPQCPQCPIAPTGIRGVYQFISSIDADH